ncbi:MAG: hypothetical protein JG777_2524 [Clostridia bacterium]|jgi:hypothetical protein|nr:hypothetical protein [Clostridia bacterium]
MEEDNKKFEITAKLILYALPIIGILGILIPIIMGQFNLALLGSYLAIPMILAPLIYHKYKEGTSDPIELKDRVFVLLLSAYFICISLAIIVVYINEVRPISFYFIITMMSLIMLLEILLFKDSNTKTKVILFQSMVLVLCILWSVNLNYFYYFFRTDPLFHVAAIKSIINNAYIESDVFNIYKPFPLWHILCTFVYHISALNLSIQKVMFFTNGIIYSFIPIITYLISIKLFSNNKISLLCALFVSINPDIISYGMGSISRSVVSFLFLLLLLLLLNNSNLKMVILSILLIIPIVMYHTASTPFIFIILLLILMGQHIYNNDECKNFVSYTFLGFFIIFNLFYWMFYAEILFVSIISNITSEAPSGVMTSSIIYTPLNELFNYIQYAPLLFFVIIGTIGSLYSTRIKNLGIIFCILGLLSVVVTFPGPILLINKFAGNFNIVRFGQFFYPFISVTVAVGFYIMYNITRKYSRLLVIILFISVAFFSVSNDFVASDNPIIKRPFYTFYFTEQEIVSFNNIAGFTSGYLMSDYPTTRYFSYSIHNNKSLTLDIDVANMRILREKENDVFLIRFEELSKRPLKLFTNTEGVFSPKQSLKGGTKLDYYYEDLSLWKDLELYNKIYDTEATSAFS